MCVCVCVSSCIPTYSICAISLQPGNADERWNLSPGWLVRFTANQIQMRKQKGIIKKALQHVAFSHFSPNKGLL